MVRRSTLRFVLGGLALVSVSLGFAASAMATDDDVKPFTASIAVSPSVPEDDAPGDVAAEAWAGSAPIVAITLVNRSSRQRLGSADIAVPSGIALLPGSLTLTSSQSPFTGNASVSAGVIRLRELALKPGKSVSVGFSTRIECSATRPAYPFTVTAKQSNEFNGTGNDFRISGPQPSLDVAGSCSLGFRASPADAQRNTAITSEIFLPTGAPVTVAVLDGSGAGVVTWWTNPVSIALGANPGAASLAGPTSAAPALGVASFQPGPSINVSASGYRLTATSAGITSAPPLSGAFAVVDAGQRCVGGQTCSAATTSNKSTATVSGVATTTNDLLRVSLGSPTAPAFICAGYSTTTEVLDFDLTSLSGAASGGRKTASFTLRAPFVTRAPQQYEACFLSPLPFTTKSGAPAQPVDTDGNGSADSYVGLLPTCGRCGDDDRSRTTTTCPPPPYVASKVRDRAGNVTLTIIAPPGDPRAKF